MAASGQDAYCTLLLSDGYLPGAMVLAHSLRDAGTRYPLAVLVTLDTLSADTISELRSVYDHVIPVERIVNRAPANLYLMQRPDLHAAFTKIALWRQTQFRRLLYVDADAVCLRAPDELLAARASPGPIAAAPDVGWPDCFNSGVLLLRPNLGDYYALLALARRGISFDGADQGLLNMHFRDWERLSFTYNCTPGAGYQYVPAYRHFQSAVSVVHFVGAEKPWQVGPAGKRGGAAGVYEELVGRWWAVYDRHYRAPAAQAIAGQGPPTSWAVQRHVKGETARTDFGYSAIMPEIREPEQPLLGETKPVPTEEQRRVSERQPFVAPQSEWNPASQPPPAESRPEAPGFPTQQYHMSANPGLFHAPRSYPAPPKDLYYDVLKNPPAAEKPKPLFPWEVTMPKPTRVFAEDVVSPESEPEPAPMIASATATERSSRPSFHTPATSTTDTARSEFSESGPFTATAVYDPSLVQPTAESFTSYSRTNAWDEVPEIDRYIRALQLQRRGNLQVLQNSAAPVSSPASSATTTATAAAAAASSPAMVSSPPVEDAEETAGKGRRPSFKLTDFPSEIERPSLPVTPAPVRRDSYWSTAATSGGTAATDEDENDAGGREGRLPGAEGVTAPQDWDPLSKLEELKRRQEELLLREPTGAREIPEREVVQSSAGFVGSPTKESGKSEAVPAVGGHEETGVPVSESAVSD